jgi:hypothetical protein
MHSLVGPLEVAKQRPLLAVIRLRSAKCTLQRLGPRVRFTRSLKTAAP